MTVREIETVDGRVVHIGEPEPRRVERCPFVASERDFLPPCPLCGRYPPPCPLGGDA
jgi:hypothetical protein